MSQKRSGIPGGLSTVKHSPPDRDKIHDRGTLELKRDEGVGNIGPWVDSRPYPFFCKSGVADIGVESSRTMDEMKPYLHYFVTLVS